MKNLKVKKSEIKSVSDMIHRFVNRQCPDVVRGNYEVCDDQFYQYNRLVAYFYDNNTLFVENFNNAGSFGSGYTNWDIRRAADHINVCTFNDLPNLELLKKDREYFKRWYKAEFLKVNENYFENISVLKHYVSEKRINRDIYVYDLTTLFLPESLLKKYEKTIGNIKIEEKFSGILYGSSWGSKNDHYCQSIEVKSKIKDLHPSALDYLTEEERKIYRFKKWRNTYRAIHTRNSKSFMGSYDEDFKIFCNPELKLKAEERKIENDQIAKRRRLEREKEQTLKKYLNFTECITNDYYARVNLNYSLLRLTQNEKVITSLGVNISIEDAKRALTLFRRYKDIKEDKLISGIAIDGFAVKGIFLKTLDKIGTNEDQTELIFTKVENHPCLVVGCHTIPYFEVERFLEHHKLDW